MVTADRPACQKPRTCPTIMNARPGACHLSLFFLALRDSNTSSTSTKASLGGFECQYGLVLQSHHPNICDKSLWLLLTGFCAGNARAVSLGLRSVKNKI